MRIPWRSLTILAVLGAAGAWYLTEPQHLTAADLPAHDPDAVAGEAVFVAGGCASCHAAVAAEGDARLVQAGGRVLKTPFGDFVVPNISPDPEAGIGDWDMAEFVTAMVKGTGPDGSHYYPAFPYTSYTRMGVTDIMDLKSYLDTLPASPQSNPDHTLAFPFNIRRGLGIWKRLYLDATPVLDTADNPVLARGRDLVEGAGHCGECHTPRDPFGGPDRDLWLAGGPNPDGPGSIPNITPHETGIGGWNESDIAYYLETGFTPDFDSAGGTMVAVIENTSRLAPEDRAAIAAYLKAVEARPGGS